MRHAKLFTLLILLCRCHIGLFISLLLPNYCPLNKHTDSDLLERFVEEAENWAQFLQHRFTEIVGDLRSFLWSLLKLHFDLDTLLHIPFTHVTARSSTDKEAECEYNAKRPSFPCSVWRGGRHKVVVLWEGLNVSILSWLPVSFQFYDAHKFAGAAKWPLHESSSQSLRLRSSRRILFGKSSKEEKSTNEV